MTNSKIISDDYVFDAGPRIRISPELSLHRVVQCKVSYVPYFSLLFEIESKSAHISGICFRERDTQLRHMF